MEVRDDDDVFVVDWPLLLRLPLDVTMVTMFEFLDEARHAAREFAPLKRRPLTAPWCVTAAVVLVLLSTVQ